MINRPGNGSLGAPKTFGGNSGQRQMDDNGNYDERPQQQRTNYTHRLLQQIASNSAAGRRGGEVDPSEGFKAFSYNKKQSGGMLGDLFSNEEILSDEQYRQEVIENASAQAGSLYRLLHERVGVYYQAAQNAMMQLKHDKMGKVDPTIEKFVYEVENNLPYYRYICGYACAFFTSDLVDLMLSQQIGDLESNPGKLCGLISNMFLDVLALEFLKWFEGNPEAAYMLNTMTPFLKERIDKIESIIDVAQRKMINISIGNSTFPFPWKKGMIQRVIEKTQIASPVLEGLDLTYGQNGTGTMSALFNSPTMGYHGQSNVQTRVQAPMAGFLDKLLGAGTHNPNVQRHEPENEFHTPSVMMYGDSKVEAWASLEERVKEITRHNRNTFNFDDLFIRVPTDDKEVYIAHPKIFEHVSKALRLDSLKTNQLRYFHFADVDNHIPLITLDWNEGRYDYSLVRLKGEIDVESILTDPEKVLPYIAEDKEAFETKSFQEYIRETTELTNDKGQPASIFECKELKVIPKAVFGNKPMEVDTGEDIIRNMTTLTDYYDPNSKLDVFGINYEANKIYNLEDHVTFSEVYQHLPMLATGSCTASSMNEFVKEVHHGLAVLGSNELTRLVTNHLTNTVNRWLVECRFYPEKKDDEGYLRITDFFKDHSQFTAFAKENDPETYNTYLMLAKNEFLMENFTLFAKKEVREKIINKELDKFVDELKEIKTVQLEHSIVIQRQFMFAKVNHLQPLSGVDRITILKSNSPDFDFIYEAAVEKMDKQFGREVPLVIAFDQDPSVRFWVVTKSAFDQGVYSIRQISKSLPIQLMNIVT